MTAQTDQRDCTRCPEHDRARCEDKRHRCATCNGTGIVPDARGYAGCACIRADQP